VKGVVINAYKKAFPNPLILKAGDEICIEYRKTDWPGWVWGTTDDGKSGWIPESYIERMAQKTVLKRDYNATELTVEIGDTVDILDEESGWFWCRTESGDNGWIPKDNVRMRDN
jgi:uncharacterized protein YgiM (DUF1202 family)